MSPWRNWPGAHCCASCRTGTRRADTVFGAVRLARRLGQHRVEPGYPLAVIVVPAGPGRTGGRPAFPARLAFPAGTVLTARRAFPAGTVLIARAA